MFNLLRFYALASLVGMLLTVTTITLLYRSVVVQSIIELAESNNQILAKTALHALNPGLTAFLSGMTQQQSDVAIVRAPPALATAASGLMRDNAIVKIKIYNRWGRVAYSTNARQIGNRQPDNPGFVAAMQGWAKSKMIYHDTFNYFDHENQDDNLIQTYIPIRAGADTPIIGVLEIYADVNPLVAQNQKNMVIVCCGVALILALLYTAQLLVVRHARSVIWKQHRIIQERSKALETLSAQMFRSEEYDKKNLAYELHEDLAQTLSAIKLNVESAYRNGSSNNGQHAAHTIQSVVPVLQHAIDKVRTMATNLRPSSLDDLGLEPTVNGFCHDFEQQHPRLRIERRISLGSLQLSLPLEISLYRIIESTLKGVTQFADTNHVLLALWHTDNTLTLIIDDTPGDAHDVAMITLTDDDPYLQRQIAPIRERVLIAGGVFSAARNSAGGIVLCASWVC